MGDELTDTKLSLMAGLVIRGVEPWGSDPRDFV